MKKFYKSANMIVGRENFDDAVIRPCYNSSRFALQIYRRNNGCYFRQEFDSEAEAQAELDRLYAFLSPRHDSSIVVAASGLLAIAVATHAFWLPLL